MAEAADVVFEGVTKRYGATTAVDRLSFTVPAGTLVTLLGPSGCGKTTLLRMLAGLEPITEGRILIGGRDVTALSPAERDVSLVFQSYALFPHMNVLDNAAYGLRAGGEGKAAAEARAKATLEMLGLGALAARLPSELSGGQQQRVAVARALVLEPRVLLFDEPLSNLDARLRRQVRDEIRALQRRLGLTVVYVTHDQQEALAVSDQVVVMRQGRIAQAGPPRTLYEAPRSRFVADFMGEANLIPVRIDAVEDGQARFSVGTLEMVLPSPGLVAGQQAILAARPQALRFGGSGPGLAGRLQVATYLGSQMEYALDTALGPLLAISEEVAAPLAEGSDVLIGFAPDRGLALLPAEADGS
jgi:iron(III) transport system ATP-binding protein